jgi:hypothetical protein
VCVQQTVSDHFKLVNIDYIDCSQLSSWFASSLLSAVHLLSPFMYAYWHAFVAGV